MAVTITFDKPLNISLQIGDVAFFSEIINNVYDISTGYKTIGEVTEIIDPYTNSPSIVIDPELNIPSAGDFIFFAKSNEVNSSSLKGYYANVTLRNNSTEKAELFSVGAEIQQSSK